MFTNLAFLMLFMIKKSRHCLLYTSIIDGYPLARAENDFQIKKDETRGIWKEYIRDSVREVRSEEYAQMLRRRYKELLKEDVYKRQNPYRSI